MKKIFGLMICMAAVFLQTSCVTGGCGCQRVAPRMFIKVRPYCPFVCLNPPDRYLHQVDTACVDFCIDKRHTLTQCMRACSE